MSVFTPLYNLFTNIYNLLTTNSDLVNGGFDVVIQDATEPLVRLFFMEVVDDTITLVNDTIIDQETFEVSAGHGFIVGHTLVICEVNRILQVTVTGVATNNITIDTPLDFAFTAAGACISRGTIEMNVDASSVNKTFIIPLGGFTTPIDFRQVTITMLHAAVADSGKFGGITALTKGIVFRKVDGVVYNLGTVRSNTDFTNLGGDVTYPDKAPAGTYATRVIFRIVDVYGQVLRIDTLNGDIFKILLRDNLLTGVSLFKISALGSYTVGEE